MAAENIFNAMRAVSLPGDEEIKTGAPAYGLGKGCLSGWR